MPIIEYFGIKGLFGKKDVDLTFKEKAQIYIGENGLGKTTILNALNYLLNCDFKNLVNINFSRIDIVLYGIKYSFTKETIKVYISSQRSRMRHTGLYMTLSQTLSDEDIEHLKSIIQSGKEEMARMQEVNLFLSTKGFNFEAPNSFALDLITQLVVDRFEISPIDAFRNTMEEHPLRILYFPTYRIYSNLS